MTRASTHLLAMAAALSSIGDIQPVKREPEPEPVGPTPGDLSRIEKAKLKRDRKRAIRRAHLESK